MNSSSLLSSGNNRTMLKDHCVLLLMSKYKQKSEVRTFFQDFGPQPRVSAYWD